MGDLSRAVVTLLAWITPSPAPASGRHHGAAPRFTGGRNASLISRFLGLILIAMGLQFVLTNLRDFFRATG